MLKVSLGLLIRESFSELVDGIVTLICQFPPVGAQLADLGSTLLPLEAFRELNELLFDLEKASKVDLGICCDWL